MLPCDVSARKILNRVIIFVVIILFNPGVKKQGGNKFEAFVCMTDRGFVAPKWMDLSKKFFLFEEWFNLMIDEQ